ncbi:ATP-binding response regulator [Comamonas flocculans]|uniref:histidine kinase n=1 Tax=Comamonas flocculans TaxID=2597701 RepID=A0A5B8S106_9BURK|nr:hybrid sensor histidine kinase/response regulator [Comamonas flocculans]QEA14157.1 hybrid sensor histidine kinase/response regulator [Comamonas flocculans]
MSASTSAPAAPPSPYAEKVLREQVAMLYSTIRTATLGDFLLALAFGSAMYWQMRAWPILAWMLLHLYNTSRMPLLTAYFKDPQADQRLQHWADTYCRELRLNSLTWGLAPLLFLPDSLPLTALMMLVMMGLCAAGVSAVSPLARAARHYLIPMLVCLMLALLIRPSAMHVFLAVCCAIFLGSILRFARAQSELLVQALHARFEKEALAAQLARQMRATEEASQQKTRFLASASHDLRQPLHAIALLGAALQKQLAGHAQETTAERLMQAVGTLTHSLDAMLDVSRLDAGVVAAKRRPIALQEIFQSLGQSFVNAASEKDITLRLRATELWADSDPQLLRRLLSNLLDNAIKYTREGGVLVLARGRATQVWIEVYDTGIGIAPEQQGRVYEEFYQVGNPGRDRALGLGIGLSVVARLARLLEHSLQQRSTLGRGTRFRLVLPRATPLRTRAGPALPPATAWSVAAGTRPLPRRVLLLDDEADVRSAMTQLLQAYDVDAHAVADEAQARAQLMQAQAAGKPFALLICDFRLAGDADGLQAGEALAREFAPLALLLVTGETAPERLRHVRSAGVPVLFKPVGSEQLLQAIADTRG